MVINKKYDMCKFSISKKEKMSRKMQATTYIYEDYIMPLSKVLHSTILDIRRNE